MFSMPGAVPNQLFQHALQAANAAQNLMFYPYEPAHRHVPLGKEFEESRRLAGMIGAHLPHFEHATKALEEVNQPVHRKIGEYINPYQQHVLSRISELGNRNLTENILPALEAKFVRLGQHGGKRHAELASRAARDIQNEISAQQAHALERGYGQAGELASRDLARQLDIAAARAQLGQAAQAARFADMEGLMQAEEARRANEQELRDYQYQEFLRKAMFPAERVGMYSSTIHGLPMHTPQQHFANAPRESMNRRDWQNVLLRGASGFGRSLFG